MLRTRLQRIAAPLALLTPTPVNEVTCTAAANDTYPSTARLEIGEGDTGRACSGAPMNAERVLTAASCFADHPALEIPSVHAVKDNDHTTQVGTTVGTGKQSYDIARNSWTAVRESADEQGRTFTLVEMRSTK